MTLADPQQAVGGDGFTSVAADAIAKHVGGLLVGDPGVRVTGVAPLDRAERSHLSFLASAKYADAFRSSRAGIVFLPPALADADGTPSARIVVNNPHAALMATLPLLHPQGTREAGIHATAQIGRSARLGASVAAGPYAVIGTRTHVGDRVVLGAHAVLGDDVIVGDDCVIAPGAVLYPGTVLGKRVVVHSGARIGSDGFGYVRSAGQHDKIPHVGRCLIGDDVEIGANTTIDRGSIDDTVIGEGTKIDNLVHIAHNVRIGRRCLIMAQVGIAGSARIDDDCTIAGQAGVAGHVTIARGATIGGQSGVFGAIPAGETWSGYPARPHRESLRASAAMFRVSAILARLERLVSEPK